MILLLIHCQKQSYLYMVETPMLGLRLKTITEIQLMLFQNKNKIKSDYNLMFIITFFIHLNIQYDFIYHKNKNIILLIGQWRM